jgi:hypothetical protein
MWGAGLKWVSSPFFMENTVTIDKEFIRTTKAVYQAVLEKRSSYFDIPFAKNRVAKLQDEMIKKRLENPQREIERTFASLKTLPYTAFSVRRNSAKRPFLMGITKPIVYIKPGRNGDGPSVWHLGKYVVGVSTTAIIREHLDGFHFVPLHHLDTPYRHHHHRLDEDDMLDGNPLDDDAETCWASIGPLMLNALRLVDIAAVFEAAHLFLSRVDVYSTLAWPDHERQATMAEYAQFLGVTENEAWIRLYGDINDIF